ncbi:MAG: heavy metal-associated domain-containing protein [Cyanobacteria bacterium P01_E01_bin.6]
MKKLCLQLSQEDNDQNYFDCLQQALCDSLGIGSCNINKRTQQVLIYFDPFTANLAQIRRIIEDAGFRAEPIIQ